MVSNRSIFFRLAWMALATLQGLPAADGTRWVAYYADRANPGEFIQYNVVVFDSDHHPPVPPLLDSKRQVLGYLSLGEVARSRPYYDEVRQEGILLAENPQWPGSFGVDIRDPRWRHRVITQLVPGILAQGFRGVFLDTLDRALAQESANPGMTAAAVEMVKELRQAFPSAILMVNRAYGILPEVAGVIDIELGESTFTTYDFANKTSHFGPSDVYKEQVRVLKQAESTNPKLRVFTLDYWDPNDLKGIQKIYKVQRANGFVPYVATIGLDRILEEPW
jgi:uncharacterized protein (TIGR01370 family)